MNIRLLIVGHQFSSLMAQAERRVQLNGNTPETRNFQASNGPLFIFAMYCLISQKIFRFEAIKFCAKFGLQKSRPLTSKHFHNDDKIFASRVIFHVTFIWKTLYSLFNGRQRRTNGVVNV